MSGTYIDLPVTGGGSSFITAVLDSNSVDLNVAAGTLSAQVLLSANAASAGFFKATTTIKTTGSSGIHVELPIATSLLTGVISAADWQTFNNKQDPISVTAPLDFTANDISIPKSDTSTDGYLAGVDFTTFSNKEPPITAGTTSQYWRGDKTFQTLNVPALTAVTNGTAAATGEVGEIVSASQSSNTTTGVAASGSYGSVVSLTLQPGSYMIWGTIGFNENGAVLTDGMQAGISASATGIGISEFDTQLFPGLISSTSDLLLSVPVQGPIDIAAPTTYYLNSKFSYTSGTPRHRGRIKAWRIR